MTTVATPPPGLPSPEEGLAAFPLSFAQQRLWFLDRLEPGGSAYNVPLLLRLRGHLDHGAVVSAVGRVVARHEVLRTTFTELDGEPVQLVQPSADVPVPLVDVADEAELTRALETYATRPFDLEQGPLLRATVLRVAPDDAVLGFVFHHIVADAWSTGLFYRELSAFYREAVEGTPADLADLAVQYVDFSVWQRQWLTGDALEEQLGWWRAEMAGAPELIALPTDRPRPRVRTSHGAHERAVLAPSLLSAVQDLGRREGTTLFMTVLGAFAVVLSRWCAQDEIVVGSPVADRPRPDLEPLIGFFTNTVPLRLKVSSSMTFRDVIAGVRRTTLGAFSHQDLPFERVVEALNPERHLSHSPVFQVLYADQPPLSSRLDLPGLAVESVSVERRSSKFDLALFVGEGPDGLRLSIEYSTDLYDGETMARLLGHLGRLLEGAVAEPDRAVGSIEMLTEPERVLLLGAFAGADGPAELRCAHELVADQARRTPEAVAVVGPDGSTLTYDDLVGRANHLAQRLRTLGVGANAPVAIALSRSVDMCVAVLGVLIAGGAYVPIDPSYPAERVRFMLGDAAATVVLTESALAGTIPAGDARVIVVDAEVTDVRSGSTPEPGAALDDLAYIIYTSGSTGRPKGVAMGHRALANLLTWQVGREAPGANPRTLQFASLSFDVAFQELFSTWATGATLVLIDEQRRRDPEALLRMLDEERVERLFLPFVALQHLAEAAAHLDRFPTALREVVTAGEALQSTPAIRAFFRQTGCTLENQYGPTESHVVTWHRLGADPDRWSPSPSIGRPLPNTRIRVLDAGGTPVPVGVPGELHIGGVALARGYHNRPDLTAERFSDDPFEPGGRLYATGDLGRWRPDGSIDFLGRRDGQVKIRGYRVELAEVEAVLASLPGVREAAATVHQHRPGVERLVAYVVPDALPGPRPDEVRRALAERLPDHMVPTAVIVLAALPLTPNGKVDRRALPTPGPGAGPGPGHAPRNDADRQIVEIWRDLLGIDGPIGIQDDFFALGGHSLLAVKLVAELERRLGVRLPLAALFESATVEHLGSEIAAERRRGVAWRSLTPIKATGSRPPLFLAPWLSGEVFGYRELADRLPPEQPVYAFQAIGLDGRQHPDTRIEAMAQRYLAELRAFQPTGPYLLGGYCFGGVVAFEMAHQLGLQGEEVALLALFDASPFGHNRRERPTRMASELARLRGLSGGGRQGMAAYLRRRARNVRVKAYDKVRWSVHDAYLGTNRPLPRWVQDVKGVNRRAMAHYVTPTASCRVTLFRAQQEGLSFFGQSFWEQLAAGGLDVRPTRSEGIAHTTIMREPHVRALAEELVIAIDEVIRP